jgi:bacillithiol biosynthesis deacetylase BshB1
MKRFLFVSPHPDDVELGAGGLILKLKQTKHKVFVVDLTTGEPTPFGNEKKREEETKKATKILKIDKRVNLKLENRYLFDSKEARLLLAEKIREFRPHFLFSPYFEDAHPDHIECAKIVESARFYAKYTKINLKGKPHYPFYLFYYFCIHLRIPPKITFLVDVSEQFKEKMRAIKCYASQFINNPKNRFVFDYLKTSNRFLGKLIGVQFAEAFWCKEVIKLNGFSSLL